MESFERRPVRRGISAQGKRLLAAAGFGLLSLSVAADEPPPRFTMTVISDQRHSRKVLKGDYEAAISRIESSARTTRESFSSQTALCVAYTKTGDLERANAACNGAVAMIRDRMRSRSRSSRARDHLIAGDEADLAVALSNRGVLHAALGDTANAIADFRASLELDAGLSAPGINIARIDTHSDGTY